MFSNILGALQGPSVEATDDVEKVVKDKTNELPTEEQASTKNEATGAFSFWGVASALADTMKQTTADLKASVGETDWRAEIEAFRKGVAEDASTVQRQAQEVAREGAHRLENLPQQAANAKFPPMDSAKMRSQFDQVGNTLGQFGTKFLASSKEIVEQVTEAVQKELDGLESHISKPKPQPKARLSKQEAVRQSRLMADISAMQRSSSTYCDEPEDQAHYQEWLKTLDLESRQGDIEAVTQENAFMAELQSRIVPLIVQYETFWTRYFYQLHKIEEKHKQAPNVVKKQAPSQEKASKDEAPKARAGAPEMSETETASENLPKGADKTFGKTKDGEDKTGAAMAVKMDKDDEQLRNIAGKSTQQLTNAGLTANTPFAKVSASHDEEAETSTASDDSSSHTPWTVVTSPSHKKQQNDQEADSPSKTEQPSSIPTTIQESSDSDQESTSKYEDNSDVRPTVAKAKKAAGEKPALASVQEGTAPKAEGGEDSDSDIDISDIDDEGVKGDNASDVEEDWGLWD